MKTIESRSSAFKRITKGLRAFVEKQTPVAMQLILEAKRLEIWKEKYSSWKEYCEKELGKSRRRIYELLEVATTIEDIQSVRQSHTSEPENKAILQNLNSRQATALKGLPSEKKAEVFEKAIKKSGGKSPAPAVIISARKSITDPPRRRSCFDSDETPRDYSGAHLSHSQSEKPEPKDRSTPADAQVFDEFSKKYPKVFSFSVENEVEEQRLNECVESIMADRPQNGAKPATTATLIAALCSAYKSAKNKTLGVSKADAREMRTLFESYGAEEIPNIVEVFKKAIVTDKFHCRNAHQLHSFGKNYGNIRNEIENENNGKPSRPGVDRNAGTANAKTIGQYDGVGKVV